MAIIRETVKIGTHSLVHTYSDAGYFVLQDEETEYSDAWDVINSTHTYTETKRKIDDEEGKGADGVDSVTDMEP